MTAEIILASASPRRRELLEQMGLAYLVRVAEVDESVLVSESPALGADGACVFGACR